MLSCNLSTLC